MYISINKSKRYPFCLLSCDVFFTFLSRYILCIFLGLLHLVSTFFIQVKKRYLKIRLKYSKEWFVVCYSPPLQIRKSLSGLRTPKKPQEDLKILPGWRWDWEPVLCSPQTERCLHTKGLSGGSCTCQKHACVPECTEYPSA